MFKLATLLALMSLPALAADVVIELWPEALVEGPVYRLKDIAKIVGDDSLAGSRLAEIEIGVTPRPGHSERLSQQQVGRFIEANAPEWRGKLQWNGSKAATVRGLGVVVGRRRLTDMAADFLRIELGRSYDKIDISPVDGGREITLPPNAELRPRPVAGVVTRRTAVWIDIQVDGRAYGAVPVWFAVQAWKQIPVARMDLPAGSELRSEDFLMESRDVMQTTKILDRLPTESGIRLRTAIGRGLPVTAGALEFAPAISRNQPVAVRMAAGNIMIETEGVAQSNGRIGEIVKVKNSGSSEIFLAKVLEPGVVSVNTR